MADPTTTIYGFTKPTVGADPDTWGGLLNTNLDNLDSFLSEADRGGRKNRVINGSCNIAQRASVVCSTGVTNYGGPDRFIAANNGSAGGQFTQSAGTITYQGVVYGAIVSTCNTAISSTTGTNFWSGFIQPIEGINCYDLVNQPMAVSFVFNTNVTGTYSVALRDSHAGTTSNSYVSTFAATANTPVRVTIPIPASSSLTSTNDNNVGMYLSIGSINTGTYQTSTLNAWQSGNFLTGSGSTNWGTTAGNFIALTQLQLEKGSVASPFEWRSSADELRDCERYFQQAFCASGTQSGATSGYIFGQFRTQMRAAPTNIANPGVTLFNGGNISATLSSYSTTAFDWLAQATFSSSGALGYAIAMTNHGGSSLTFSAEL